jgi:hypothetical protein
MVGELFQSDQCVQVYAAGRDGIEVGEEQELLETSADPISVSRCPGAGGPPVLELGACARGRPTEGNRVSSG